MLPKGRIELFEIPTPYQIACIINEDIEPAERVGSARHKVLGLLIIGQIGRHWHSSDTWLR